MGFFVVEAMKGSIHSFQELTLTRIVRLILDLVCPVRSPYVKYLLHSWLLVSLSVDFLKKGNENSILCYPLLWKNRWGWDWD